MKREDLPEIFVNRENFRRLIRESNKYRRQRNMLGAICVFGAFVCLITLLPN